MNYLYLINILIFSLVFRNFFRIFYKGYLDTDTGFHLYFINHIRRKGLNNLAENQKFIRKRFLHYPWLMHLFLSLVPKKFDHLIERYFNISIDISFLVFLYILTYKLTETNSFSLYLCILYLLTPITYTTLNEGPRVLSLTPRLLGEVFGGLVFIFEYLFFLDLNFIYLIVACIFSCLAILVSKFALQALFLISSFLFLMTFKVEFILVLAVSLFSSIIFTQGRYLKILKDHIDHLKWYFDLNLKNKMKVSDRNSIKKILILFKKKNFKELLKYLIFNNSYFIILFKFPIVLLSIVLIFMSYSNTNNFEIIDFYILSASFVFFITSLKWFLFLGEAERYFNFVIFFILLKCILYYDSNLFFINLIIIYGFLYYLSELFYQILHKKSNKIKSKNNEIINWLNSKKKVLKIATIPYGLGGWRIVNETKHNWLNHLRWENKKERFFLDSNFMKVYPILDINKVDEIIDRYKLDYVICDKKSINRYFGKNFKISKRLKKKDINSDIFAIFK